jgi:aldehyde:ferredoxin oxidoreductase
VDGGCPGLFRESKPGWRLDMKAQYGYMGKMLFVDLTNRKVHEELKQEYYRAMGFDFATGAIQTEEITRLGLQDILR